MNSQSLLLYVLKSIFISGAFLGYYRLALRNKNFNSYNRFYLLLSMTCSLVLPLFNFNWFTIYQQAIPVSPTHFNFITTQIAPANAPAFSWLTITGYLAGGISLLLIALFALNVIKVYQLKRRSAIVKMDGIDFINTNLEHAPFSFLNTLFWKASISLNEEYGKKIFKHELTHINQKHTLDIIFCQVVTALFWMNPFNWLIQKELKAIHEFIADKEAVGNNNVEEFVKLLLQAHYGKHFLNPTHAFYYSSIKRRLFMLTTTNSTTFSRARKLLVLPVALLVVVALSVSTIESKANALVAPIITAQQTDIPTPSPAQHFENKVPGNDTTPAPAKAKEQPPKEVKSDNNSPKVVDTVTFTASKAIISKNEEIIMLQGDNILIRTGSADSAKKAIANILYFINDQPATADEVNKLAADKIRSINVLKGNSAIKKYGDAGANGVIEIITKLIL
jgi:beta-lactamase regulating signal transducer with metallopeptidase domain